MRRVAVTALGAVAIGLGLFVSGSFLAPDTAAASSTSFTDPETGITVTQTIEKVSAGNKNIIRAGDVVQVSGAIVNPASSGKVWTAADPLTFATDLSDIADDAVTIGLRGGVSASCAKWYPYGTTCPLVDIDNNIAESNFALASKATYYFTYQAQVSNRYVGNLKLANSFSISGTGLQIMTSGVAVPVAEQHPDIAVSSEIVNVTAGSVQRDARAGDVVDVKVRITNTGLGDWTAGADWAEERLVTFNSDVTGLIDDAVISGNATTRGIRQGASTSCANWYPYGTTCPTVGASAAGVTEPISFALKSGATHHVVYRMQVLNSYDGDLNLDASFSATGAPGNNLPQATSNDSQTLSITEEHPGLELTSNLVNVTAGNTKREVRAGDIVDVKVQVRNPGPGDWTASADWAKERLVTFESDIAGLLDDSLLAGSTVTGVRQGANSSCANWYPYGATCLIVGISDAGATEPISFALKSGATHHVVYRMQVFNSYDGDLELSAAFRAFGEPGNDQPRVEVEDVVTASIEQQHPGLDLTTEFVNVTAGKTDRETRAGDIVDVKVRVKNTGPGDWTSGSAWAQERLVTFESDITGLLDDAVLENTTATGMRQGAASDCANWYPYGSWCPVVSIAADGTSEPFSFSLKSGATHYVVYRVQVGNTYTGDQNLSASFKAFGEPGNGEARIEVDGSVSEPIDVQHPGLEVTSELINVTARGTNRDARAGDIVDMKVRVKNTGPGDWTPGSTWAEERLVTFEANLAGLIDDAVLENNTVTGMRQGADADCANWYPYGSWCPVVSVAGDGKSEPFSFSLKSGASHYVVVRAQIRNTYDGDLDLNASFNAFGEPGNGEVRVESSTSASATIDRQHPELEITSELVNVTAGKTPREARAGDIIDVKVRVKNPGAGDWPEGSAWAEERLVTYESDVSNLVDDAVLEGNTVTGMRQGKVADCANWYPHGNWCGTVNVGADGKSEPFSFALKSGATHYVTYRAQVRNDYTGDQMLAATFSATGEPGNGIEQTVSAGFETALMEVQFPQLKIDKTVERISGNLNGEPKAGDVYEYRVKVSNPGRGDWTVGSAALDERLVTVTDDLSDVLDDAVWLRGSSTGCAGGICWDMREPVADKVELDFALRAGASRTLIYQVQLSDAFTGNLAVNNLACATGDSGHPVHGILTECASTEMTLVPTYPDIGINLASHKTPNSSGPVRAGDRVTYTVTFTNTGDGDWNMPSKWAVGNPLTLTKNLSDILDDAVIVGSPSHGATVIDDTLHWTGALASGQTREITFSVRVHDSDAQTGTDLALVGEACATGDTRNPGLTPSTVERCAALNLLVGERWEMAMTSHLVDGAELRPHAALRSGDTVRYEITAQTVGGWQVENVHIDNVLADVLDKAELSSDVVLQVPGEPDRVLPVTGDRIETPTFVLPSTGHATLTYDVTIPTDRHAGTLQNLATGTAAGANGDTVEPLRCGTAADPCETIHRFSTPHPTIDKRVSGDSAVQRGDTLTYTVTVNNPGPGTWSERNPILVIDDLHDVLDDATLNGAAGAEVTLVSSGNTDPVQLPVIDGTISWQGSLGAGESLKFTYQVTILEDSPGGNLVLANTACTGPVGFEFGSDKNLCGSVRTTIPVADVEIDTPVWGSGSDDCVTPPWIELPVTPGIVYTIDGDVKPGGSVTITASARPGYNLVVPEGWSPAADGGTATFTVNSPTCEPKLIAYPDVKVTFGACVVDGENVPPTLGLVETEGVIYNVDGEVKAGSTVTVTARALPGYFLATAWNGWNWTISADRQLATKTFTFPELTCEDSFPSHGIAPDYPVVSGPNCDRPDAPIVFELPETPGITYTVQGVPAPGATLVITATADDGNQLGYRLGWSYSDDRTTATYTARISSVGNCESGDGSAGGGDGSTEGGGSENGDGGSSGGDTGGDGSDDGDNGAGGGTPDIEIPPFPAIPEPECVAGEAIMPDLSVILVPGVWYDIEGKIGSGETLVLHAYTLPGYILKDTADWMTGDWIVADDRKSATRTVVFPTAEDLCGELGQPETPLPPVDPEQPVDPESPGDPELPVDPENPDAPELPENTGDRVTPAERDRLAFTGGYSWRGGLLIAAVMLVLGAGTLFPRASQRSKESSFPRAKG